MPPSPQPVAQGGVALWHGVLVESQPGRSEESARPIGVGPWFGLCPTGPGYDHELLELGDRRNVADRFRYRTVESIAAELAEQAHPLHVAIENWQHDFNIGSVVRTANAFNVASVRIVGQRRWNRRGAMMTEQYLNVVHHSDVADLELWARTEQLPLIGVDNVPGSVALETEALPRACVVVFGGEALGLTPEALAACRRVVAITQFGSTRSINAGAAAAIVMHAWARHHVFGQKPTG